jgi:hypothetical protein
MRFLILRSGETSVDGHPDGALADAMRAYEDGLRAAGVVLAAEELRPGWTGTRLRFDGADAPTTLERPFAGRTGVVNGFYILDVRSEADAIEWARRCPVGVALLDGERAEVEIRRIDDGPRW